jgi:uncharacterized protein (DUF697 family)
MIVKEKVVSEPKSDTIKEVEVEAKEAELAPMKKESTPEERALEAQNIIKNHMMVALGFGVVPVPIVDLIGLTGTQLSMLKSLSDLYGQKFTKDWGKKSIASLLGGGLSIPVAMGLSSLIKSIPILGQTAGAISMATTGASVTYAIGKVFVQHFESGGTFLTFDPVKVREHFESEIEAGKNIAKNIEKTEKAKV